MKDVEKICRLALMQAEPCMFGKNASVEKTVKYIDAAAENKPDLIVFPELFIPGYPIGMNFGFSMGKRTEAGSEDWMRYSDASIVVGDAEFNELAEAAKRAGAYVSIGFSERDAAERQPETVCRGGSCVIDPYGHYLTEPVWNEERIIYAELDMSLPAACKMEHDVVGHYARPDVLELIVHDK